MLEVSGIPTHGAKGDSVAAPRLTDIISSCLSFENKETFVSFPILAARIPIF